MRNIFKCFICGVIMGFFMTSCGPMNKNPQNFVSNSSPSLGAGDNTNLSKDTKFYIHTSLSTSTPVLGDNHVQIRSVYANTLEPLSDKAKMSVVYRMPEMPQMGDSQDKAMLQSDGSFLITLFLSMAGRWQIIFKVEDGPIQDEYIYEVNL